MSQWIKTQGEHFIKLDGSFFIAVDVSGDNRYQICYCRGKTKTYTIPIAMCSSLNEVFLAVRVVTRELKGQLEGQPFFVFDAANYLDLDKKTGYSKVNRDFLIEGEELEAIDSFKSAEKVIKSCFKKGLEKMKEESSKEGEK